MNPDMENYLRPTPVIDCDHPSIREKSENLTRGQDDFSEKAKSLFYFVRDEIRYNFYPPSFAPEELFRASHTLFVGEGFCIPKAILLAALARAAGIPAALGFADIINHLLSGKAMEFMGTNLLRLHGYVVLFLEGKWVKATPAFDLKMCEENRLIPVEFDGKSDAMLPSHDRDGRVHIEYVNGLSHQVYVKDLGHYYDDIQPERLVDALMEGFEGKSFTPPAER